MCVAIYHEKLISEAFRYGMARVNKGCTRDGQITPLFAIGLQVTNYSVLG